MKLKAQCLAKFCARYEGALTEQMDPKMQVE